MFFISLITVFNVWRVILVFFSNRLFSLNTSFLLNNLRILTKIVCIFSVKKITLISLQTNENLRELHLNHNSIGDRTLVILSSALSINCINSFMNCQARGIFSKKSDLCHGALPTETFVKYQYMYLFFSM